MSAVFGVIGDIHASWPLLDTVLDALATGPKLDGVLLVGDFCCAGRGHQQNNERRVEYLLAVDRVFKTVAGLGVEILYVPGNHDHPSLSFSGNIDGSSRTVGGLVVAGIGGAGPDKMGFCYEWDEADVRTLKLPVADILLSHCPALNTDFDRLPSGAHVGSKAVAERLEAMSGVAVFGHIHEAHGVGQVGNCLVINPGGLGPPMAHPRAGWVYGTDAVVLKELRNDTQVRAERRPGR